MLKPQNYQCPECGIIEEHWNDEEYIRCYECAMVCYGSKNEKTFMIPIFTPKQNSQRAYVRDERK